MTKFLQPSSLLTDLYQLTMLQGYLDHQMNQTADFEFFVRDLPSCRNFLVAAGLEQVLDFLEELHFTKQELEWLSSLPQFNHKIIDYLADLRFEGNVYAMPEGSLFFANEPILRISAPIAQAQLVETRIINLLQFQTMIASKAVRTVIRANGKLLVDFGLRRAHGAEAGIYAARASYLAGFSGTSTVLAGKLFDIPLYGTMAHSFIQAHDDEESAFENFAQSQPRNIVLLIDTYDIEEAVESVINLAKKWKKKNMQIQAIRIDSGDLIENSRLIRKKLDSKGHKDIKIFASGNLDEYALNRFDEHQAPIDGFGIGTLMTTSADAPYLECAYKLVQYAGQPRYKQSAKKETQPCPKQVFRFIDQNGKYQYDEITANSEKRKGMALLQPVMTGGKRIQKQPALSEIRNNVQKSLKNLPDLLLRLESQKTYPVKISPKISNLTNNNKK